MFHVEHVQKWADKLDSLAWKLHSLTEADGPPTPEDLGACTDILFDVVEEMFYSLSPSEPTPPQAQTNTNGLPSLMTNGSAHENHHPLREHGGLGQASTLAAQNQDRIRQRLFKQALQGQKAALAKQKRSRPPVRRGRYRGNLKGRSRRG